MYGAEKMLETAMQSGRFKHRQRDSPTETLPWCLEDQSYYRNFEEWVCLYHIAVAQKNEFLCWILVG